MSRSTIDFGIDLGTTNSAIAVLRGTVPDVIKNNLDNDITPSAVYIDKRGQTHVGSRAKQRMEDQSAADDVYIEFKRRMGTDHRYEFRTSGRTMRPEEVSAEVLKTLKGDVQQRLGEVIDACVITVPAAFEAKQCAATKKAGELAGFSQCPLIMEPTAAALAYGFQTDSCKEYWLVYDFGGGTFDACLMKAEDGSINIVNHGGDNYLGGSDIDWAIIDHIVIPQLKKQCDVPDLARGNKKWRTALAVIKRATEAAKIELSRSATAYLEDCKIRDATGVDVEPEIRLERDAVVKVAEPIIMRSVEICKRVLREKGLSASAIEKVILVGGPTLAPYFRDMLSGTLGIRLDHSVDPLTVVAKGAAVFAGTQRREVGPAAKASAGQFNVEMKYQIMGPDVDPTVQGKVTSANETPVEGFTVEFANRVTRWRSGKITLKPDGRFKTRLVAERGDQNVFDIELVDATGTRQVTVPDSIPYTVGVVFTEEPNIHSISVALANNEAEVFFKKGDPLPAKAMKPFRTSAALQKGQSGDVLKVPVIEGENSLADRNVLLGSLDIRGAELRRDVPAGAEVEVTLIIDKSRIVRAKAYVPMLDEEFEAVIRANERSADPVTLKKEYEAELQRLATLRKNAAAASDASGARLVDGVTDLDGIKGLIEAARDNPDEANKAERQLLEVKIALDHAEEHLKWPALRKEAQEAVQELNRLLGQLDSVTEEHKELARNLESQIETLLGESEERPEALRKAIGAIHELYFDVQRDRPEWWVALFRFAEEERNRISDQTTAERLLNQGRHAIQQGNLQMLRQATAQLMRMLPPDIQENAQRRGFHGDKGLLR